MRHRRRRRLGEGQDGSVEARGPQLEALLHQGHGQPLGPGAEGGSRHLDGAVAVGFDNGAQNGGGDEGGERAGVVRHGGKIHFGPRRAETAAGRQAPTSDRYRDNKTGRSPATSPSLGPLCAASPWAWAARAAASNAGSPRARKAAITPVRTSPVPAVARRGEPDAETSTLPSGEATTVVEPFNRNTAPVSLAAARTSAMRSSPGARPVRRRYSPSCGVTTIGAFRPAATERSASRPPSALRASASTTAGRSVAASSCPTGVSAPVEPPGPLARSPSPGPTARAFTRRASSDASSCQPSAGRLAPTCSPGGRPPPGGEPGTATRA